MSYPSLTPSDLTIQQQLKVTPGIYTRAPSRATKKGDNERKSVFSSLIKYT